MMNKVQVAGINWHVFYENPDRGKVNGWHSHRYSDYYGIESVEPVEVQDESFSGVLSLCLKEWNITSPKPRERTGSLFTGGSHG